MFSWTHLLVVICSTLSSALCCDWLRYYSHLSDSSLTSLRLMGGQLTEQDSPVPFPKNLYRRIQKAEVQTQLVFIRDSLKMISDLWSPLYDHDNPPPVTWNPERTEQFLMSIHRQMERLNTCVSIKIPKDRRLIKYYKTLKRRTLRHTGGSVASWELIRRETKWHLDRLDLLVSSIRSPSAESQRRR